MKLSAACVLSVVCVVLPASALDCSAKRDFKLLDIYGSAEQAQKCFAVAVSTFKSKWNVDTHTGPCLRAAFHDAGECCSSFLCFLEVSPSPSLRLCTAAHTVHIYKLIFSKRNSSAHAARAAHAS
eukprot:14425-Heterococcus_DN1.PRE.3